MPAKLRTLTGCLQCRRRRKKCDEDKPNCLGCRRNGLICHWQNSDHVDRRRLRHRKRMHASRETRAVENSRERLGSISPSLNYYPNSIDNSGSALVEYCLLYFLPSQYHQSADGKSTVDLSYLRYMCLESRLLLNAVSACALATSSRGFADNSRESSYKLYMNAISEISTGIAQGAVNGTEDYLLATVLWLCVYENYRVNALQQSSIHAAAMRRILLLREPMNSDSNSMSELVWERMCVEAYIYHSVVTTLFDCRLDLIEDILMVLKKFKVRNSHNSSTSFSELDVYQLGETDSHGNPIVQSPVLGAPYKMFLLLVEGIRLVRTICPGDIPDEVLMWSRYYEVHRMQFTLEVDYASYADSRRWIGKLYAVSIRLLLLYIISILPYNNTNTLGICSAWYKEMQCTLSEARNLLIAVEDDIDRTWGKFFLWPLAIIGAMIYDKHGISLVKIWLDRAIRKSNNSNAMVIRKVLEELIWNHENHTDSPNGSYLVHTRGLSIMFNTDIMNYVASSLITGNKTLANQQI